MRRNSASILPAALALALTLTALLPMQAGADVGTKIIERCTHGESIAGFTQQNYRRALEETTAEVNEYSDCVNLIHKAQLAAAGGSGPSGGSGGGASALTANVPPPTPAEQLALQAVHRGGGAPVRIGDRTVVPGVVHADVASAVSTLPTPLLALLCLLLAGVLLALARTVRDRVRVHRRD